MKTRLKAFYTINISVTIFLISLYCISLIFQLKTFNFCWLLFSSIVLIYLINDISSFLKYRKFNIPFFVFFLFYFILIIFDPLQSILLTGDISYSLKFMKPKNSSLLLSGLSHAIFFLIILFFRSPKFEFRKSNINCKKPILNLRLVILLLLINLIGFYPYLADGVEGFVEIILSSRSIGNSQFKNIGLGNNNFIIHLSTLIISVGSILGYYILYSKSKYKNLKIFIFIVLIINILIVASSGTRTRIILLIVPIFSYIIFLRTEKIFNISNKKILIFTSFLLILLSLMTEFRKIGFSDLNKTKSINLKFDGLNLNNEFIYCIEKFSKPVENRNFFQCIIYPIPEQLIKFITNPIPRVYYKNKYLDPSFAEFNQLRIGNSGFDEGFNITPTIFGRFYMLYGFIGIFYISFFIGFVLKKITIYINNSNSLFEIFLNFCFLAFLCQSIRDLSPGWIYSFIFTYLIYRILKINSLNV